MKSPQSFKYSPNGYRVRVVEAGTEMTEADKQAAIDLGIVKARKAPSNKANGPAPNNK